MRFWHPKKIVRAVVRKNGINLNQCPLAGAAAGGAPSKKNIAGQGFAQFSPGVDCHLGGPSGGLSPPSNLPGVGQKGPIKIATPGAFFCRPDKPPQALPAVSWAGGATAFHVHFSDAKLLHTSTNIPQVPPKCKAAGLERTSYFACRKPKAASKASKIAKNVCQL